MRSGSGSPRIREVIAPSRPSVRTPATESAARTRIGEVLRGTVESVSPTTRTVDDDRSKRSAGTGGRGLRAAGIVLLFLDLPAGELPNQLEGLARRVRTDSPAPIRRGPARGPSTGSRSRDDACASLGGTGSRTGPSRTDPCHPSHQVSGRSPKCGSPVSTWVPHLRALARTSPSPYPGTGMRRSHALRRSSCVARAAATARRASMGTTWQLSSVSWIAASVSDSVIPSKRQRLATSIRATSGVTERALFSMRCRAVLPSSVSRTISIHAYESIVRSKSVRLLERTHAPFSPSLQPGESSGSAPLNQSLDRGVGRSGPIYPLKAFEFPKGLARDSHRRVRRGHRGPSVTVGTHVCISSLARVLNDGSSGDDAATGSGGNGSSAGTGI